jgi:hypothetical protein
VTVTKSKRTEPWFVICQTIANWVENESGLSKRIWGEFYKVIDCSDVIIQVLHSIQSLICVKFTKCLIWKGFGLPWSYGNSLQASRDLYSQRKKPFCDGLSVPLPSTRVSE